MTDAGHVLAPPPPFVHDRPPAVQFSVILPVHQSAEFVHEALESLEAQTRPPYEVIVSDDGSTDHLEAALRPFRDRIVLVLGDHAGPGAARNRALRVATGSFVVGLDADDVYLPDRLARLEELARSRPDLDILATDAFLEADGQTSGRFNELTSFAVDDQRTAILDRCFAVCPAIRRTRLLAVGGYDESLRSGEDWDVLIRLILSGCTVGLVDVPLYRYRLRRDSLTANRVESLRSRVSLLTRLRDHPGLTAVERRALEHAISHRSRMALRAEAEVALIEGRDDRRLRSFRLALSPSATVRERATALAWAGMPRHARRQLKRVHALQLMSSTPWERSRE